MPTKPGNYPTPYDQNGNLLHWAGTWRNPTPDTDWRPNTPFHTTLMLDSTRRGMSAAYFVWRDDQGHTYPMFVADVAELLRATTVRVQVGRTTAWWMVRKRGANYGLRVATAAEIPTEPKPAPDTRRGRTPAWKDFYERHPEVGASWGEQNGYEPSCTCCAPAVTA